MLQNYCSTVLLYWVLSRTYPSTLLIRCKHGFQRTLILYTAPLNCSHLPRRTRPRCLEHLCLLAPTHLSFSRSTQRDRRGGALQPQYSSNVAVDCNAAVAQHNNAVDRTTHPHNLTRTSTTRHGPKMLVRAEFAGGRSGRTLTPCECAFSSSGNPDPNEKSRTAELPVEPRTVPCEVEHAVVFCTCLLTRSRSNQSCVRRLFRGTAKKQKM